MPRASNACGRWGVAATLLLLAVAGPVVLASPAGAQTQPSPAPNPLESLLPNLLAPLAPLLNPNPQPTAPNGGGTAPKTGTSGPVAPNPAPIGNIPKQVEVQCGGVPAPLVFARTPGRTTKPLLDAAAKLTPPGGNIQQTMLRIAAPFPVAGSASYRDDWGEPRSTPCPHLHQGNDIFANMGTPVVAPEAGVVARYGFESVGGNSVYFSGDDGYSMYGAHLMGFAPGLAVGQHVAAGTLLGYVGNTGDAAGGSPHLHFQLYPPGHAWGSPVDPKFWLDDMLNRAIGAAGGVVPPPDSPYATAPGLPPVNVGSLMNSLLLAGGHIISQPTVPVLLFVALLLGVLLVSQTRTFKVAAELRRSRSSAEVPTFLVGGTSGLVKRSALTRKERHMAAAARAAAPKEDLPVWAAPPAPAEPAEKKLPVGARLKGAGRSWARFPEKIAPSGNGHANGNGYTNGNGNGHTNGNGNGHTNGRHPVSVGSLQPWSPGINGSLPGKTAKRAQKTESWSPTPVNGGLGSPFTKTKR